MNCDSSKAAVSAIDVAAEVQRLVPHVDIGAAPTSGSALVNLETLLWAETPSDVALPPDTLLGHRLSISAHVDSVHWDFGDHSTGASDGPGKPYGPHDSCGTKQCPGFFGHTYSQTGTFTITATITWSATYTVDGGSAQPVQGTVTGPPSTIPMRVRQARAILVPDPTSTR